MEAPLEALSFNYASFDIFTVVNNLWTWIAVVTAAISVWRFKATCHHHHPPPPVQEVLSSSSCENCKKLEKDVKGGRHQKPSLPKVEDEIINALSSSRASSSSSSSSSRASSSSSSSSRASSSSSSSSSTTTSRASSSSTSRASSSSTSRASSSTSRASSSTSRASSSSSSSTSTTSTRPSFCEDGVTKGRKFMACYHYAVQENDDVVVEKDFFGEEDEAGIDNNVFDVCEKLRMKDMGLFDFQDLRMLNGNIVRLWDDYYACSNASSSSSTSTIFSRGTTL